MKKIIHKLKDLFHPLNLQALDSDEILAALNDASIRKIWLLDLYEELKRLNLQIDAKLISGSEFRISDLCARRKAFQDVLEAVLTAKRQVRSHNPAQAVTA